MSSTPLSQKISLFVVLAVVAALLAPYAGCDIDQFGLNQSKLSDNTHSDEEEEPSNPTTDASAGKTSSGTKALGQIEDLLSN